jgi:hypothetical protein
VLSSNGQRHEFTAESSNLSDQDLESEILETDIEVESCSEVENSDQYTSDDGFVVNDDLVQYDTDYESFSEEEEYQETQKIIQTKSHRVSVFDDEAQNDRHDRRRAGAKPFTSALQQLEEMRWKRRKTTTSQNSFESLPRAARPQRQEPHGSKYFSRPAARQTPHHRQRWARTARSDSDSDAAAGTDLAAAPPPAAPEPPRGGWLSRLKSQVTAPS